MPIGILILGVSWFLSGHSLETGRQWLDSSRGFGPLGFIVMGTALMCVFVPKTFVSLASGGLFGFVEGAWILSVTALVSAMANYQIGRWSLASRDGDAPTQTGVADASGLDPESGLDPQNARLLHRIASTARDAGVMFHLLTRLTPLPTTVISYTMGAAKARRMPYAIAALIGSIPQWLWVYCGATAASGEELSVAKIVGVTCSVVAAIVLSVWVPRLVLRSLATGHAA